MERDDIWIWDGEDDDSYTVQDAYKKLYDKSRGGKKPQFLQNYG